MRKISIILFLMLVSFNALSQWYYSTGEAANLENRIKFKNNVRIGTQSTTPSSLDYATGSMVLKTDGTLWLKQYGDSNQWGRVASASDLNLYVLKSGDTITGDLTVQGNIHAENYVHTGAIRATSSAGILVQNQANNNVMNIGPANTQNVSIYGGLNIDGQTRIKTNEIGHILSVAGVLSGQQYATNSVIIGNGYGAFNSVAPGTQGNLLISNGTAFESATGSGYFVSSLNGLTNNSQTFATGSSGGDFNISSSAGVHTLNIPNASASNRGALTQSDFQTFTNKVSGQAISVDNELALFSGTGGKTIKRATGSGVAKVSSGVFATGSVNLANDEVSGVLNIANGGTNNNSFTNGQVVIASGSKLIGLSGTSNGQVLGWSSGAWVATASSGGAATYKACGATIAADGTVNYESDDCVDSCSWNSGNGRTTCTWTAGFWSVQPNCSVTAWQASGDHRGVSILGNDTTSFVYRVSGYDSSQQNQITSFTCIGD